jgi:hypothetical protein
MKKLVTAITILTLSILLVACGGGSSSSGTSLSLTGLWRLNVESTDSVLVYVPASVLLQQSGNKVVSTRFISDLSPGNVPCSVPAPPIVPALTGTASGNTLSGTVTTSASITTFSVSGDSSLLTGTFQTNYHSGVCLFAGVVIGRITLSKF